MFIPIDFLKTENEDNIRALYKLKDELSETELLKLEQAKNLNHYGLHTQVMAAKCLISFCANSYLKRIRFCKQETQVTMQL